MRCGNLANLLTIVAVKARRPIFHALLALLLVLSQQLGLAHAVSHWSGYRQGMEQVQDSDGGVNAGLALDHNCSQCLAFAQLASAIYTPEFTFPTVAFVAPLATAADSPAPGRRNLRPYDSRAPPLA